MAFKHKALIALMVACCGASVQAQINSNYRIQGDREAAPVQVFDNGKNLYVQLRDPRLPPAPFINNAPALYKIMGYYMVLPLVQRVELRYGDYAVLVSAKKLASTNPAPMVYAPMVAAPSIPVAEASAEVVSDVVVSKERIVREPTVSSIRSAAQTLSADGVVGEISVSGAGVYEFALTQTFDHSKLFGSSFMIIADGTSAGAQYAMNAANILKGRGKIVNIQYSGMPAGRVKVERKG